MLNYELSAYEECDECETFSDTVDCPSCDNENEFEVQLNLYGINLSQINLREDVQCRICGCFIGVNA